jgi:ribosome-binding protein aMBF1 (putative translation factor)
MRKILRQARLAKGLTHNQIAEHLGIKENSYKNIEWGFRNTSTKNWDKLEDLLGVPQRQLRKNESIGKD